MHFTSVAILLQLTVYAVVYGRFWGPDFKRQNDDLLAPQLPPATQYPCNSFYNIDKSCPISSYPTVGELMYARSFESVVEVIRKARIRNACTDYTGWLECMQRAFRELPDECREQIGDNLGRIETALAGALKFTDDVCVKELRNTRKHINCFLNATLIEQAERDCYREHIYRSNCNLDALYECVGEKIEETEKCKRGAAAFLERVTRPLFDAFTLCPEVNNELPEYEPDSVAKVLRSMKDIVYKKKIALDFFKN